MTLLPPELTLAESIPLVAAWASRVADEAGIRLLLIKGQPATDLGVRADRPSVDVDVWVDPAKHEQYLALLATRGWERLPSPPKGVGFDHAVAMSHSVWATTIDVHRSFPGFFEDPDAVFEAIWSRHTRAALGGALLHVPDTVAAGAITVLHGERSLSIREAQVDVAAALRRAAHFTFQEQGELLELARTTRGEQTLRPLLMQAGIDSEPIPLQDDQYERWLMRTRLGHETTSRWLVALALSPWGGRPRLLIQSLKPTESDYANSFAARTTARGAVKAGAYRWGRGIRALRASWSAVGRQPDGLVMATVPSASTGVEVTER